MIIRVGARASRLASSNPAKLFGGESIGLTPQPNPKQYAERRAEARCQWQNGRESPVRMPPTGYAIAGSLTWMITPPLLKHSAPGSNEQRVFARIAISSAPAVTIMTPQGR